MNRLQHEKSPYLLQHANNPVDWYPWGEDAFSRAKSEEKPIFLSIGYSTCHWCHVMERESFENEEIARILNQHFIPIKVDREERPDVDRIYMAYVQAATGGGGWPMSVWLTPDLKPFVGGTYFPPDNRYGRPGFPVLLERIAQAWRDERERIMESSRDTVAALEQEAASSAAGGIDAQAPDKCFHYFRRTFDAKLGGFGPAPKFPRPVVLNFLLRYYARTKNAEALDMVLETLRAMARGGMHDQLGGGFHRYSVDEYWFVPHFEKMLYDQAQLVASYVEAFQITGDEFFSGVARKTIEYVLRDMTDAEGGFYSAEDADSLIDPANPHEKGEGAFYIWSLAEIEAIAGQPATRYFAFRYGAELEGNVRNDPHQEFTGKNILFEAHTVEATEHHFEEPAAAAIGETEGKLLAAREHRVRPYRDNKILAAWNGLMISALAKAGAAFNEPRYNAAARHASEFILSRMVRDGVLLRRYRTGEAAIPGFLDDYAFFVQGLLDLGEIESAAHFSEKQSELFEDKSHGGFFSSRAGEADLIVRLKEDYDGAEPSGNAIAVSNLLRLARITGRTDFEESARRALEALSQQINESPFAVPQLMAALELYRSAPKQVILSGEDIDSFVRTFHSRFLPNHVLLKAKPGSPEYPAIDGKPTAYVCEGYVCLLPTNDLAEFSELLQ